MQRLDKILSSAGAASRKELRTIIRAGRVTVNGLTARDEAAKFDETSVKIFMDGEEVELLHPVLLMMNKPSGLVTSADDPRDETVLNILPERWRRLGVMPVGRLDKETEGLLLLTNDGQLAHKIISPKHGVWKTYYCEHEGTAGKDDISAFLEGLVLKDGLHCLPAILEPICAGKSYVRVQEGKYHQVRRMMASRGMPVSYLKRTEEGGFALGDLPRGEVRELSIQEAERMLLEAECRQNDEK